MKQILCFGDSNTWGLDGETGKRFSWEERWTGILQEKLADRDIRIVVDHQSLILQSAMPAGFI